jgi:hypothetical protein
MNVIVYSENQHDFFLKTIIRILIDHNNCSNVTCIIPISQYDRVYSIMNRKELHFIRYKDITELRGIPNNLHRIKIEFNYVVQYFSGYFHNLLKKDNLFSKTHYDFVIFLGLYSPFKKSTIYQLTKSSKVKRKIVVIHDIRGDNRNGNLKYSLVKFIDNLIYPSPIFEKFILLGETLSIKYAELKKVQTLFLPFILSSEEQILAREDYLKNYDSSGKISFLIPGNVSGERKNYSHIFNILARFPKNNYNLTLLGKVIDYSIIIEAQSLNLPIIYYEDYVSNDVFNKVLSESCFVIYSPNISMGYETYKVSGIPYDAYANAIPLINLSSENHNDKTYQISNVNKWELFNDIFINHKNYVQFYGIKALNKTISYTKYLAENYLKFLSD